jgi:hypothetical protein
MNKLSMVAAAALLAGASACIFVVDGDGTQSHSAWNYDWDGDWNGTRVRGSGKAATQAREVEDFHAVSIRSCADARIRVGQAKSVNVTCDDNLIEHLVTRVEDGVLVIETDQGSYSYRTEVVIDISVPALDGVAVSGSGDVTVDGLDGGALGLDICGSGDVTARGTVDELTVSISGSGDMALYGLSARSAKISISGSGDVELEVREELSANISGSGDVSYRGSPEVRRSVSGSGSVEHD